ncbi:uncharacterized protein LOC112349255 [Selaginella moellendorffii]|uniref:uncharacterized protein LOC112349255 n=1 Tax=Selaginella moellendorffii TaxID=88036 RepID=UPI000D1CF602|nr:uncharacterized protein LOC112349255 [Selaginella moellendorffii]|eukprot:XP_024539089.1 uncharacterized protein LOC112349255 [Selaginella moellendorffii]
MEDSIACSFELSALTEKLWHASVAAKIRRRQCRALHLRCSQIDGYVLAWKAGGSRAEFVTRAGPAMLEMVKIFKRALKLVGDCGGARCWLQMAAARLHSGDEFLAVLEDLEEVVEAVSARVLIGGGGGEILRHKCLEHQSFVREELLGAEAREREKMVAALEHRVREAGDPVSAHALERLRQGGGDTAAPPMLRRADVTWEPADKLGQGASGTVYRADWLGQAVAVKVFKRDDVTFEREVAALVAPHPHVLQVIGYLGAGDGDPVIVMELMRMDLRRFLDAGGGGGAPSHLAIDLLLQIARGTQFLHDHGVVHRDLKPQNVLVDFDGNDRRMVNVLLTDFGIARTGFDSMVNDLTSLRGTPRYMAPEMMASAAATLGGYSRKVDVYSFGVLCSEVLTGSPPFGDKRWLGINEVREMVDSGKRPELPASCPGELRDLITRCWSGDAESRPAFSEIERELASIKRKLLAWNLTESSTTASNNNTTSSSSSNSVSVSVVHHDDRSSVVLPGVEELRLRGAPVVGSNLGVRLRAVNGAAFVLCQWICEGESGIAHQPPVLVPVITAASSSSIPELTRTITAAEYRKKLVLQCLPLSSTMRPGIVARKSSSRVGLGGELQETIERSYAGGQASFKVVQLRPRWWESTGKLFINRQDYLLWWGQGNPKNVRYSFSDSPQGREHPAPLQLSPAGPMLCDLRRSDGSSCVIKFTAQSTRDAAVLTMMYFWERRHESISAR